MQRLLSKYFFIPSWSGLLCLILFQYALADDTALNQAKIAFQKGDYEDALRLYEGVTGSHRAEAVAGASRVWLMTGEYSKAEQACRAALSTFPQDDQLRSRLAEVLTLTGRSDEAIRVLEPAVSRRTPNVKYLVQYGELLALRGRKSEAEPYFKQAISFYDRGLVFDAEEVAAVAEACRALERFHDANHLFREATRLDPNNLESHVLWGNLFLEKYNVAEARRSYSLVLDQNNNYVPALVGMAQTADGRAAKQILDSALEINARSVPALVTRAGLLIENDRYGAAEDTLHLAFQINPESAETLTLMAAIAYLKGDEKTFQELEKIMETLSPGNGRFYSRIAEICGRSYRFNAAVQMAQKAVSLDPGYWNGYTVLGMNLLRLGNETRGRSYLETGFQGDPFNVWAMNILKVLDTLEGFETRQTGHFVVRMHPSDAEILWPYLEPLLIESWNTLTAKYDFKPQGPILIEIFTDHEDFAVRTSGLPDIGHLLGVCFGKVITLDSPQAHKPPGSINWQEVIWHEFMHVITLQMTNNKIPRWLSEGVSVFEENNGRPEWGRRQDIELIKAVQENRIMGIAQLDEGFSQARTLDELSFAYYESSILVEFIVARYGFETLKKLIYQYATFTEIGAAFKTVFHVSLDEFEKEFIAWINQRVETINVHVPAKVASERNPFSGIDSRGNLAAVLQKTASVDALRKRIEAQPRDFEAQFQLGLILYRSKDFKAAIEHLTIARDLLPGYSASPSPREILAAIYEELGETQAMIRELEALVKVQQHAFKACFKLGQAAQARKDFDRAVYYFERAIAVNPYDLEVHRSLGAVFMQRSEYPKAIREYGVLLALDSTDPALANADLADAFLRDGNKAQAKRYALAALEIAPMFERAQDILLDTLDP